MTIQRLDVLASKGSRCSCQQHRLSTLEDSSLPNRSLLFDMLQWIDPENKQTSQMHSALFLVKVQRWPGPWAWQAR